MTPTKNRLSIVIPAYNEEERIGKTLEEYYKFFKGLKKKKILDFEIIVVLNACKDNTLGIVKEYQKRFREISYLNFEQGGKGFAITMGFRDSLKKDNDLIGFIDADLATTPEAFYDLVKNINNYDGVIGSRWKKGAVIKIEQTLLRKITSRSFNFLIRSILHLNYSDTQCGAKLFKKNAVKKVVDKVRAKQWAFDVDLLYNLKKEKFEIKEIPTIWEDKGGSKINLVKSPLKMFSALMRLRLIHSPFDFIVRAYDKFPEKVKIHNL